MCTIAIEALTPLYRTLRIKLYKNIARSRLFCRIAKRSIAFQNFTSHSSPIFSDFKILRLHDLFQLELLCFVYESAHKLSPICFHNFFQYLESVHQYGTRQAGKDDIFRTRKNTSQYGLRSVGYYGAKCWNDIPVNIKRSPSLTVFCSKLKTYFFENNY